MEPMVFIIGGGVVLLAILATLFYAKAKTGSQLTVLEEQLRQKEMQLKEQLSTRDLLQTEKEELLRKLSKSETQLESSQQALVQAKEVILRYKANSTGSYPPRNTHTWLLTM